MGLDKYEIRSYIYQNAQIFQKGNKVLSDVNFEIEESQFVYLIGKTGSGKSSLLKTIYGELKLNEGVGSVDSFDLTQLKPQSQMQSQTNDRLNYVQASFDRLYILLILMNYL